MCGVTGIILSSYVMTCNHETKIPRLGHMITSEYELGEMLFVPREVDKWILSLFFVFNKTKNKLNCLVHLW